MQLTIISPTSKNEYRVDWLEAHTNSSSFIIKPGHAPIISRLQPGKEIIFSHKNKKESIMISDGLLKCNNDKILIIITQ